MITLTGSVVVGMVMTICVESNNNQDKCDVYIPATYETKTLTLATELCKMDIKKYAVTLMTEADGYLLDVECKELKDSN